jgi:riboflavin kinase/FMN adenylyltransferase
MEKRGRLVVIGNFDGVHRGHQAVLSNALSDARSRGLEATLLTFSPHPAVALGRTAPALLTRLPRKLALVRGCAPGLEPHVERFDAAFAAQSPEEFAADVRGARLAAKVVVVGGNFRFGRARAGDFEALRALGDRFGFATRAHDLVGDDTGPWSSTRARAAIAKGDLDEATRILGREHMLTGVVVKGDQRGRTIGFPTCNVAEVEEALPTNGVYAVRVEKLDDDGAVGATLADGVANLGVRPTVKTAEARPSLEVHLFDFDGDLYGARLGVRLVARLRDERRFSGLDELRAQIALDATNAREKLSI